MADKNSDEQCHENTVDQQELHEFETRLRMLNEAEINRKIQQWLRRIEQFVVLNNKPKGRKLYYEIMVMVKILKELSIQKGMSEEITITADDFGIALLEVDLMKHPITDFDMQKIIACRDILFRFPSYQEHLSTIYEIARQKFELLPLNAVDKINLDVAINEAIGNAQRHGHQYNESLPIEFRYIHNVDKLIMRVLDQGTGFNCQSVLAKKKTADALEEARARYQSGGYGGLGIMMMLKCVNLVEYNEKGNQITLIKYLQNSDGGYTIT